MGPTSHVALHVLNYHGTEIDIDDAVDLGDKPKRRQKSYGAGEKEEDKGQEKSVSEVENR